MKLISYIFLLAGAAYGGVLLQQIPDVVMLSCQDWSVEMPMWLGIVLGSFSLGIMLIIGCLINELIACCANGKHYFSRSKKNAAHKYTTQALLQLAQAQWGLAEKNAIKGAACSALPFINYVSAAKAAQEQNAWGRRDEYLALAAKHVPDGKLASGIIKAKLQDKQGSFDQSIATLQELRVIAPKHPLVLRLLGEAYEKTKAWPSLLDILPEIKKHKSCPPYMLQGLAEKAYQGLLLEKMQASGKQAVIKFWHELPKETKQNVRVVETYASCLVKLEAYKEALEILRQVLKKTWDQKLIRMYGLIPGPDLSRQIFIAERWLQEQPGDPALLLALARLCLRNQLWGKAKDYLEISLQIEPSPEAYAELGRLFGSLGEAEKCQDCYRKGLLAVTNGLDSSTFS